MLSRSTLRVSQVLLVTSHPLFTDRTQPSRDKRITSASVLSCYRHGDSNSPVNEWLNNLLADRQPAPLRLLVLLCLFLGPAHHSTSTDPAFSSLHHYPPSSVRSSSVLSFHFRINPSHPSGSFYSFLNILFLLFFFLTPLVLFLPDFFGLALFTITPHGNWSGHVILALHAILSSGAGWP